MLHPGEVDPHESLERVAFLFQLMNWVVEDCITKPKRIEEMYASLTDGQRAAIEKRDAPAGD